MAPPTAPPAPSRRRTRLRRDIGWSACGLAAAGTGAAVAVAPADAGQGDIQRLMYLHVPAAWTAYAAFTAVLLAGVAYAMRRDLRMDRYAQAAAEVGVAATVVTIVVGSVWGRAVWGVWWAWDPRLVSTVLLLLVYTSQLAVRHLSADRHRNATRAAAVGIAGFLLLPVIHFSVVWWRSLHQPPTLLSPDPSPPIDPVMAATLMLCVAAMLAAAAWVVLWRQERLKAAYDDRPGLPAGPAPGDRAPAAKKTSVFTGSRR